MTVSQGEDARKSSSSQTLAGSVPDLQFVILLKRSLTLHIFEKQNSRPARFLDGVGDAAVRRGTNEHTNRFRARLVRCNITMMGWGLREPESFYAGYCDAIDFAGAGAAAG